MENVKEAGFISVQSEMFVSSQNAMYIEALTPTVAEFGDRTSRKVKGGNRGAGLGKEVDWIGLMSL